MVKSIASLVLLALTAAGCAGFGIAGLDPKQIEAASKIKDAGAVCVKADVALYGGVIAIASIDKGILGKVTVAKDCVITIETKAKEPGRP